jgi:hypothetical protein
MFALWYLRIPVQTFSAVPFQSLMDDFAAYTILVVEQTKLLRPLGGLPSVPKTGAVHLLGILS